jgi:hypothetical protein
LEPASAQAAGAAISAAGAAGSAGVVGPYKVYWNYLFVSFIENYARQAGPLDLDMVEVKIPDSQRVYSLERPMLIRISRRR